MALVLGIQEKGVVEVGPYCLEVEDIINEEAFEVSVWYKGKKATGTDIITGEKANMVCPDVLVSAGMGATNLARVIITAPKSMKILRWPNVDRTPSLKAV